MLLTGHVPPGYTTPRAVRWMYPQFNKKFVDLVLRHSDVITAMHFGHEHHDNFRLFYNSSGLFIQFNVSNRLRTKKIRSSQG